ncbi:MAG: hypothetical protein ACR2OU_06225 [Thermomicrobiales bacterium]
MTFIAASQRAAQRLLGYHCIQHQRELGAGMAPQRQHIVGWFLVAW